MSKSRISPRGGFTLIEVLIGMTIILTIAAGMFGAFVAARKASFHSRNRIAALHFAKETAERLKDFVTFDITQPRYQVGGTYALAAGTHQDDPADAADWRDLQNFTPHRNYVVEDVDIDGNGVVDYNRVIITVTWEEPRI